MSRRGKGEGAIYQRKDGRWTATITLEPKAGKRRRRSFYGRSHAEVAKKLRYGLKKLDDNLPIPDDRQTVGAYLDAWLRDSAAPALRPRTLASYKMIVELHLKPEVGPNRLARLQPADVRAYINKKLASGLAPRTVQYHHAVLRRALGQAERDGAVARNVARLVSPPKIERPEIRPLTPEQARTLLGAIAEDRLAPLYACAIGLGLRQGELLGLTWDDLDLDAATLTIRHTLQRYGHEYHLDPPKTDKSRRTLGLPVGLVQRLRAHRTQQLGRAPAGAAELRVVGGKDTDNDDVDAGEHLDERQRAGPAWEGDRWNLVFCTETGRPLPGNHITRQFQAILAAQDPPLPRQRFHDLRHAAATYMLTQGVDLRVVMEVLGHSQIHVTANTYAHVKLELTRTAAEQVDALLTR